MSPDVYAIPLLDRWLLHAPLHRVSAVANGAAVVRLRDRRDANGCGPLAELHAVLGSEPLNAARPLDGPLRPQFLGLVPTRACNLQCVYCGFGAAKAPRDQMECATAVAAIDWMAECVQSSGRDTLEVHFFGGEPFAAGDVVDVAVHRTRAVAAQRGLVPRFEVATNGVFDEARARFVGDYFDTVVLSFDGPLFAHDRHRPMSTDRGSFDAVARTARRLRDSPTKLCFRMCVTRDTVTEMEDVAGWFCSEFAPAVVNFETLKPTPGSERAGLQPPDPYEFAAHCVRASRVVRSHGLQAVYAAGEAAEPRCSFCPVGHDALIVSPDGRVSSCYLLREEWEAQGIDLDLGRLAIDGTMLLDRDAITRVRWLAAERPRCTRCFCRWTCAGGCHVHHSGRRREEGYDAFCIQTRIITACSLLGGLGHEDWADDLLASRGAMEALALRRSDCLYEGRGTDG